MPKNDQTVTPAATQTHVDTTRKQQPDEPGNTAKLPHERDQSVDMTDGKIDPQIKQAHRDLERGLVDTDARGADGKPLGSQKPSP